MKQNILIICLSLVLLNCQDKYLLSLDMLLSGSTKYNLNLINRKKDASDNDLFYSGSAEYMDNIIVNAYNNKGKYSSIKEKKHPLVLMLDICLFEYINYFSTDSIFVINHNCINFKKDYTNYTIFSIVQDANYMKFLLQKSSVYYIKLGKDIEKNMNIFLYIIIGITGLINIFLSFIMKRILKNMNEDNVLLINYLICNISDLLSNLNLYY